MINQPFGITSNICVSRLTEEKQHLLHRVAGIKVRITNLFSKIYKAGQCEKNLPIEVTESLTEYSARMWESTGTAYCVGFGEWCRYNSSKTILKTAYNTLSV